MSKIKSSGLLGVLVFLLIFTTAVSAGGMTKVENYFSLRAWYGATGSGIVHERWNCDANWENCSGNWTWFPMEKFTEPPECEGNGPYQGYVPDVGDGSNILKPGWHWYCIKSEIFRNKYDLGE